MKTVYRYEVMTDGEPQAHSLCGPILAVGCRNPWVMEFWALSDTEAPPVERTFRVFETGHPGVVGTYVGTAVAPGGALVWHLFELDGNRS